MIESAVLLFEFSAAEFVCLFLLCLTDMHHPSFFLLLRLRAVLGILISSRYVVSFLARQDRRMRESAVPVKTKKKKKKKDRLIHKFTQKNERQQNDNLFLTLALSCRIAVEPHHEQTSKKERAQAWLRKL